MRYLVVGTLPPPRLPRTASLLAEVDRLELEGHEVEVLPVGVGDLAARRGGLGARTGADVLAAVRRRAGAADAVVVQLEPELAGGLEAGRGRRAAAMLALASSLGSWGEVELRLESFDDLPGGVGGRAAASLWRRATRVVVPTDEQRGALHAQAGVPLERIVVARREVPDVSAPWPAGAAATREAVLDVVRRRAAADRVLAGWHSSPAVARMLAESVGPPASPFGPLEPLARYVYERPALREPVRRVLRVVRRRA